MLEAGLRRALVRDCFSLLCQRRRTTSKPEELPLFRAFQASEIAKLEVGDWINVRLVVGDSPPSDSLGTGWRQIGTGAKVESYEPMILVSVNVGALRRQLRE